MRSSKISRINYSTSDRFENSQDLQSRLRESVRKLNEAVSVYFELSKDELSMAELEEEYQKVMEKHEAVTEAQIRLYRDSLMTPPPPPIPPVPERLMQNRLDQQIDKSPPPPPE